MKNRKGSAALLSLLLACALLFSSCSQEQSRASGSGYEASFAGFTGIRYTARENGALDDALYTPAAQTPSLSLLLNEADGSLMVTDKRSGAVWSSSYDLQKNGVEKKLNQLWRNNINSLVYISYFEAGKNTGVDSQTNPLEAEAQLRISKLPNGFTVTYDFTMLQIRFDVSVTLEGDSLVATVPFDSIQEGEKYRLSSIALLPVFASASSSQDGYCFYPDGCGALSYFRSQNNLKPAQTYRFSVYGSDGLNVQERMQAQMREEKQAMLPVFGVANHAGGMLAVISQGEADSAIAYSPSNLILDINQIYASFTYRRKIDITQIAKSDLKPSNQENIYQFDMAMEQKDAQVTYFFLSGEDCGYNAMANRYRDYLLDNGGLNQANAAGNPLALDLFMGTVEDRAMFSLFMTATTFAQAEKIVTELRGGGVEHMLVTLKGWNRGGYRESVMPSSVEGRLGSQKELEQLARTVNQGQSRLYLYQNYRWFTDPYTSFNKGRDVAFEGTGLAAEYAGGQIKRYLPGLPSLLKRFLPGLEETARSINAGIALEGPGDQLYPDFNKSARLSRVQSGRMIREAYQNIQEKGLSLASGGNQYALASADYLRGIPMTHSGFDIGDETVPFYQMVVHGSIPYSSAPANLDENLVELRLKWAEYGYMPTFELTWEASDILKYTGYNTLFSSRFETWKEQILSLTREMDALGVASAKMVRHQKLEKDVYETGYDNGVTVTVNYSGGAYALEDGRVVEAGSFLASGS